MALLERCVCGAAVGELLERNSVLVIRCACGVGRLHSALTRTEYLQRYTSGEYHRATDRHPGCLPYAERYDHDLEVAAIRWQRYGEVLGDKLKEVMIALDVGCASGAFVDYLVNRGLYAWGIDPSPEFEGRHVVCGTTADFGRLDYHDLVTYHDVLEHVLDPEAEVQRAARLLRSGGLLIVDVPDVWSGRGDHHFKLEHLWYFTPDALAQMFGIASVLLLHVDRPIPGKLVLYGELQ